MNTELLRQLTGTYGPSGCEEEIRALIAQEAAPFADDVTTDALGNLIVHKAGPGKKVMFSAHMDSVGLMVTHIEEKGFLRFAQVGGLEAAAIYQTAVRFANGTVGVVSVNESKQEKSFALADLFIDIGAANRAEAEALVQVGDMAVFAAPFYAGGGQIVAPYLDDRAGCYVLLQALRQVQEPKHDLYFVFSTQEEVGTRGAKTAAWRVEPDYGIAVDVTCPDDVPGAVHDGNTALGKGAAIKVMDHSVICAPALVKRLQTLAEAKNIPAQLDLLRCGGTDAGAMLVTRSGVVTGGISIPCRYTHAPTERVTEGDIQACIALVQAVCESELEER
jgi:endoglucanase